jgi:hypothetical protein
MPLSIVSTVSSLKSHVRLCSKSATGTRNNVLLLCLEFAKGVLAQVQRISNYLFRCGCDPLTERHVCKMSISWNRTL